MSDRRDYAVTEPAHAAHQICVRTPYVQRVPRISSFYGIVIAMYYREHGVPHFHALYGEYEVSISIESLDPLHGYLPSRALRLVRHWAFLHREELLENWDLAEQGEVLERIAPLP